MSIEIKELIYFNNSNKLIKLYNKFNKLIILLYSKIFVFEELFTSLITFTIVKIENIE